MTNWRQLATMLHVTKKLSNQEGVNWLELILCVKEQTTDVYKGDSTCQRKSDYRELATTECTG